MEGDKVIKAIRCYWPDVAWRYHD